MRTNLNNIDKCMILQSIPRSRDLMEAKSTILPYAISNEFDIDNFEKFDIVNSNAALKTYKILKLNWATGKGECGGFSVVRSGVLTKLTLVCALEINTQKAMTPSRDDKIVSTGTLNVNKLLKLRLRHDNCCIKI